MSDQTIAESSAKAVLPEPGPDDGYTYATLDFDVRGGDDVSVKYRAVRSGKTPTLHIRIGKALHFALTAEQWRVLAATVDEVLPQAVAA